MELRLVEAAKVGRALEGGQDLHGNAGSSVRRARDAVRVYGGPRCVIEFAVGARGDVGCELAAHP
jgi:hypothetical protein